MATSKVTRVVVNRGIVQTVSRLAAVQTALRTQGALIAARARQIEAAEGDNTTITLVSGIRPGGRAYTNVVSDNPAGEYGTSKTSRRRALGRAADIGGQ